MLAAVPQQPARELNDSQVVRWLLRV